MIREINCQVAIIGGGIAGLVSAALLSKYGYEVCIVEKENHLGGCIYNKIQNGHILQGGAHHLGGLGEGEIVSNILKELSLYSEDLFIENNPLIGKVETEEILVPFRLSRLKDELISNFPLEKNNILRFFSEIECFKEALTVNNSIKVLKYFQAWSRISFYDLLTRYFEDMKIAAYLCALGPGYGGITSSGSAFTMVSLLATYGSGAYNVKGSMNTLVDILEDYVKKNPKAIILKGALVNKINIENGMVQSIECISEDCTNVISLQNLIVTSDIGNIYKLVCTKVKNNRFHDKINSLEIGYSPIRLFLSFERKRSLNDYIILPSFDVRKWDESLLYSSTNHNNTISMFSFPTVVDRSLCPKNQDHMLMTILTNSELIKDSREGLQNKLYNMVDRYFPSITIDQVVTTIATNEDIEAKTFNRNGSVFGWKRGINEVINSNIIGPKCMFKNFYVAGNWGPTFGVYGAFYSSKNAVNVILNNYEARAL